MDLCARKNRTIANGEIVISRTRSMREGRAGGEWELYTSQVWLLCCVYTSQVWLLCCVSWGRMGTMGLISCERLRSTCLYCSCFFLIFFSRKAVPAVPAVPAVWLTLSLVWVTVSAFLPFCGGCWPSRLRRLCYWHRTALLRPPWRWQWLQRRYRRHRS